MDVGRGKCRVAVLDFSSKLVPYKQVIGHRTRGERHNTALHPFHAHCLLCQCKQKDDHSLNTGYRNVNLPERRAVDQWSSQAIFCTAA